MNSRLIDILALVLGEAKEKDRTVGTNSDQHTEAASPALPRPCDPLLDDVTTKISINKSLHSSLDSIHEAVISDAIVSRELRKCLGLEDTHNHL
jgi:hypothetical protein